MERGNKSNNMNVYRHLKKDTWFSVGDLIYSSEYLPLLKISIFKCETIKRLYF